MARTGKKEEELLGSCLSDNTSALQDKLQAADVVFRSVRIGARTDAMLVYLSHNVDVEAIRTHLVAPLQRFTPQEGQPAVEAVQTISMAEMTIAERLEETAAAVLQAKAALLIEGEAAAYLFDVAEGKRRSVTEPASETVIRGPREGFTESIGVNLSLIRFKMKNEQLRIKSFTLGRETKTTVALLYLDHLAEPKMIDEATRRIESIDIDAILESGYIEELIEDNPISPFPQFQYTERPDNTVSQLLEGRFAILVDGTPLALVAPVTAWQFLQASEDYYERYMISNLLRWLRMFFMFVALFLPSIYIAVTTSHQDMLPTTLILSIAGAREAIPFPALIEALIMEISFEALREAGIRLPKAVGQAVSILGALVIGQSAVQAGIVSAPMVIIVSLTGIASFCLPRFNFAIAVRILRFPLMLLAGMLGLFGLVVGALLITAHLSRLSSFGTPYLAGVTPNRPNEMKDIFVRMPWWRMVSRPKTVGRGEDRISERSASKRNHDAFPEW